MARKTGSVNHTHQYFRRSDGLWACSGIDDCSHYMPKNMHPAPVGRKSVCWGGCGKELKLTPANMTEDKPMCDACLEAQDDLSNWIESKLAKVEKPTGLAAFGARVVSKTMADFEPEEDQVEVIEPDETHAYGCAFNEGGECDCK